MSGVCYGVLWTEYGIQCVENVSVARTLSQLLARVLAMIHQSIMGGLAIDSTGRKATNEKKEC